MFLELSDEEFRRLLLLASLGERVVNDWTLHEEWGARQRDASDFFLQLCARARGTANGDLVREDAAAQTVVPTQEFERQTDEVLASYDEDVFWDELVLRFARRDLFAEYGEDALKRMSERHLRDAERLLISFWDREVGANGIERLHIKEERRPLRPRRGQQQREHIPPFSSTPSGSSAIE